VDDLREPANLDELLGFTFVRPAPRSLRYEKWCRWLDRIDRDLTDVLLNRAVWRAVNEIIRSKPDMPASHFFDLQALNYATAQAVAVRRQAEVGPRVVTLGSLLHDIADAPTVLSRRRRVGLHPWGQQHIGHEFFDEWEEEGTDHVDAARVLHDVENLSRRCESVKQYVDRQLAHADKRPPREVQVTFDDLDRAIDALGTTFRTYNVLVKAQDRVDMEPVPQYDWLAPFRTAWLAE
jgi:hypothetical protein